jgi:D-aminopeptidase
VSSPPAPRGPRLRELGLHLGGLPAGPRNAITDVPGVTVGHVTVWRDEPGPPEGRGVARTGVTVVVPGDPATLFGRPLPAGVAVLNGAGELTGALAAREWGLLETPVYLTASMQVGRVLDGAVAAALAADPAVGTDDVVLPVVGECDDSWLNDARAVQVDADDAGRALTAASADVAEGCVGAGTGMCGLGWKAGVGTASRVAADVGATVGVLALVNLGGYDPRELRIDGVPVGAAVDAAGLTPDTPPGSCICVVAVDLPLAGAQLERVARRCGLGLARAGSVATHGSGEIFLAFATEGRHRRDDPDATTAPRVPDRALDSIFRATVEATEEAVASSLWAAVETDGRDGRVAPALPHEPVLEALERHGRLHGR